MSFREGTGIFFRVKREGKWCNLELEKLGNNELAELLRERDEQWKERLILALLDYIRELQG